MDNKSKNLLEELEKINEMGRYKPAMVSKTIALTDTIQEHLWKIYAYHKDKPQDMRLWLVSLNSALKKLRLFNIAKGKPNAKNLEKHELYDLLADTCFGNKEDSETLNWNWHGEGYPLKEITDMDNKKLIILACKYVDYIIDPSLGNFTVEEKELLC